MCVKEEQEEAMWLSGGIIFLGSRDSHYKGPKVCA